MTTAEKPLAGILVLEVSLLGAAAVTTSLVDLGAEVIKVEPPGGDYGRVMTWPIVEGDSLLFLHCNRGKQSIVLDLKTEQGVELFKELVAEADVVVEAMRPGALERRGLGYETLKSINPQIVHIAVSGFGATGPYRDLPSHGIAFDAWAGVVEPECDEHGRCTIPPHVSIGLNAAPLYASLGILAGIIAAQRTGVGTSIDLGQAEAAAAFDWLRIETWRAYERPQTDVTGNATDNFRRREPGTAGMSNGVRYQFYETANGHILFMASEQKFWKNFCEGAGRNDLFERWPGTTYADHAVDNEELRTELIAIFRSESTDFWAEFGARHNTAIVPANSSKTLPADPHFSHRTKWLSAETHSADMLPLPLKFDGFQLDAPGRAPTAGQHSQQILRKLLQRSDVEIERLLAAEVVE
jgi:crotonobetainyl-CoA:carnitine CoA-transferase CaiB-like acyl-CoA transferase